ncbi:MAG: glycosyltransferase family 2 protein [Dysgonamonadaceae bacterium]|nr:glycosyltransferase family 2 protein [Dysgonamonadaceae bacterium]MDD4728016.1 glycosyltransferase family 2 protein [Dysgonamonadaceae bacterium]
MKELAPVILFTYNRPWHTQQVLHALQQNVLSEQSKLFVFSDGAKNPDDEVLVRKTRDILTQTKGFKEVTIIERPINFGLADNIINGVTSIIEEYGKVIVLEDDLITAPTFLTFMNNALSLYEDVDEVAHIHSFCYSGLDLPDTFLIKWVGSLGWATWSNSWKLFNADGTKLLAEIKNKKLSRTFDFDGKYPYTRMLKRQVEGKNNSWAIRWNASLFLNNKLSLNTGKSLVHNIGFDGSGENSGTQNFYNMSLYEGNLDLIIPDEIKENAEARKQFENFYKRTNSFSAKAKRRLQRMAKGDFS